MDKMVQRAIDAARDNVGPDTWLEMRQTDRTNAIYRELRRSESASAMQARLHRPPWILRLQLSRHLILTLSIVLLAKPALRGFAKALQQSVSLGQHASRSRA